VFPRVSPTGNLRPTPGNRTEHPVLMLYELYYWCWQKNEWRPLGGMEFTDFTAAARAAEDTTLRTHRAVLVRDAYSGEVVHQTATAGYQPAPTTAPATASALPDMWWA
jgi:hypothetical protein